ncbi:hypothetical protein KR222_011027, partial [Zaprionus bogoriensis]
RRSLVHRILDIIKICVFLLLWVFFTVLMIITAPHQDYETVVSLEPSKVQYVQLQEEAKGSAISVKLRGKIDEESTYRPGRASPNQSYVIVAVEDIDSSNQTQWRSREWRVFLGESEKYKILTVKSNIKLDANRKSLVPLMRATDGDGNSNENLQLSLQNMGAQPAAFSITLDANPLNISLGVLYALMLLIFLYTLIIFDIADRTFAALLTSTLAIGVLCLMGERPSLETIISWIDMDTLMLLFGMMLIVAVLAETGVFDYLSVYAYHMSKGQPWVLIFLLCMLTVSLSAFLDNVTIVMLMVPVIIRLTECTGLRTTTVLIAVAIFSNIGGTLTPVGDPPNVIIATNPRVEAEGVNFVTFVMHMFPGVLFSVIVAWIYLWLVLRKKLYDSNEDQMRQSIRNLTKHAAKFNAPTPSEEELRRDILARVEELKDQYRRKQDARSFGLTPAANFIETLAEMEAKYKIKNKPLLIKCCIALTFAVVLFALNSLPFLRGVTLAWAAMLAAILLLILANKPDMEGVLDHVEWSTLLFFAGLFVLVEAVSELGLIDWVGEQTIVLIVGVNQTSRVIVAILLMMWISAIFSAFVDNIPIVTMMLKLAIKLSTFDELELPLLPLVWALSFGVCFGGNGTLIAASSNVVAAGIANQHGYKITFWEFFKYGFPIMLITDVVATIYLLIAHGLFQWH